MVDPEMNQMLELAEKNLKATITIIFKEIKQNMKISGNWEVSVEKYNH